MEVGLLGNKKCVYLIQARVHSTRLPGKIFFNFFEETVLERIIRTIKNVTTNNNIYILTGNKKKNFILNKIAKKNKIGIYFGNEKNVFLRFKNFLNLNQMQKFNYVYRVTADNYLIQAKLIKIMVHDTIKNNYDYAYINPLSHYAGEVISKKLFSKKKISKLGKEHVTWDFRNDKKNKILKYKKKFFNINHDKSLTLDNINDFVKMKKIENKFKNLKEIKNFKYFRKVEKKFHKI